MFSNLMPHAPRPTVEAAVAAGGKSCKSCQTNARLTEKKVIWGAVGPLIKQPRNKLLLSSIFLPNLFSAPDLY